MMDVAVHITHEAVKKIGGIGAVIEGMCTASEYRDSFQTTLVYGPMFSVPGGAEGHETIFSTALPDCTGELSEGLRDIARRYSVDIVYGRRNLVPSPDERDSVAVDTLLVGTQRMNEVEVVKFKYRLWQEFGIQSDLYEGNLDYEQYLRIAVPYLEILETLYGSETSFFHFAHEYMGVPCALSAVLARDRTRHTTAFVAHEVSTARFIVESHPGHDLSFYNILAKRPQNQSLEDVFGSQKFNPRNELIKLAVSLDLVFPVSDLVRDEYLFLVPEAPLDKITTVHNGVPVTEITYSRKEEGRSRIIQYVDNLLNFEPGVFLTHVSRLVISKGIWRDIALLYALDELFDTLDLRGVYILLSTFVAGGRPPDAVLRMEDEYGWPVLHKDGWPDLVGMETEVYRHLELFNSRSRAIKGIFINQFGFNGEACGRRVPKDSDFLDLRMASDAELGFSVYEPFGIAQLETIPFGGAAILSSTCGCASFLERTFEDTVTRPFYIVDFTQAAQDMSVDELKSITVRERDKIERQLLAEHSRPILDVIPVTPARREAYLKSARQHAPRLSWERAMRDYLRTTRALARGRSTECTVCGQPDPGAE
jgi:hypothetical protein